MLTHFNWQMVKEGMKGGKMERKMGKQLLEDHIKYRIIGSLVLLALAVIILPFFLDGAGYQETQKIPPLHTEPEPEPAAFIEVETVDVSDPDLVSITAPETTAPVTPATTDNQLLGTDGLPQGWLVQLASFKNQQNAKQLQSKLQATGIKAYLQPKGEVFRVLAGPVLTKEHALQLKAELLEKFKLSGIVVLYEMDQ